MQLITGKQQKNMKLVIYGTEGIGKTTFASQFPKPLFIDTESGSGNLDVVRTIPPSSFAMLMGQLDEVLRDNMGFETLVLDTADWAERMIIEKICASMRINGIEDVPYGKGWVYVSEDFGRLLNKLTDIADKGMNVVVTAHAQIRKFEQPDELGSYDRWELKLGKRSSPLLREWCDALLFANYKTLVVNVDNKGAAKGKNKASGGQRVMYTTHHPCWDAKNRFSLPEEMPFDFGGIAHLFQQRTAPVPQAQTPSPAPEPQRVPAGIPGVLWELMEMNHITEAQIRRAVAKRGYYPEDTPIENYDPAFVDGSLIGAWQQVYQMIQEDK